MKWVTFISCLFLISFAESRNVPRRYRDVEPLITIVGFIPLPEETVKLGTIALLSQYVQNATFEEVEKLTKDVVELAKVCDTERPADPRCRKYAGYVCLDLLCNEPGLAEKYHFTECCVGTHLQRYTCFLSHKNETPGFIPPFQKPDAEEGCKQFQDHRDVVQAHFVYEVARRYPTTSLLTLVAAVHDYDKVLKVCCQEAEKEACFSAKATVVSKKLRESSHEQRHICSIEKDDSNTIFLREFVELSQKFPKASLSILHGLALKFQYTHEWLCQGNTLQGFFSRADFLKDMCDHKFNISAKLDNCCGRPLVEQPACIGALQNDDKPADLTPTVKWLIDKKALLCYAEDGTTDWARLSLLFEYSRRHPELSLELILRLNQEYLDLLQKCCKSDELEECVSEGGKKMENQAAEALKSMDAICDFYDSREGVPYQDMLLVEFTKRVPQLSFEELYKHTKQFVESVDKCCRSIDSTKLVCIEGKVDHVLGDMCRRHEAHPINQQFGRCCSKPYYYWLTCFNSLGVDENYAPVPFSPEFHEDLCSANPNHQQIQKQRFFVNLTKSKPTMTVDQRETVNTEFNGLLEKCCRAENHKECFKEEGPKLVERTKTALQDHEPPQLSQQRDNAF